VAGDADLARILAAAVEVVPEGKIVVALSGGADSAVAVLVVRRLDPRRHVRTVFVDHGWPASGEMRRGAAAVAAAVDVPLEVVAIPATTTETEARPHRLAALERASAGAPIVTGHHADDVAETTLLNLVRGSGAAGLASIPPVRSPYVRPLLGFRRATLRRIADVHALPYVDDPANEQPAHARSLVRTTALPALERVNPDAVDSIRRSAALLAADDALLARRSDAVPLWTEHGAVGLPAAALTMLPLPIASRVVRRALRTLRPPYAGSAADVATVVAAVGGARGELSGGLRCGLEGALVVIHDPHRTAPPPEEASLCVPGEHVGSTHRVVAEVGSPFPAMPGRERAMLRLDQMDDLVVRAAARGERIEIGIGSKLVRDARAEAGVPSRLRGAWPVVARHGKIAWIVGVRTSAWAGPARMDDRVVRLTTERLGSWMA
jgi:tRNA(Ile)-lysidine synthase